MKYTFTSEEKLLNQQTYFQRTPSVHSCPHREGRSPRTAAGSRGIGPLCAPRTPPAPPPGLNGERKRKPEYFCLEVKGGHPARGPTWFRSSVCWWGASRPLFSGSLVSLWPLCACLRLGLDLSSGLKQSEAQLRSVLATGAKY